MNNSIKRRRLEHWQWIMVYLAIYDVIAVSFAYFAALWLRFDLRFSEIPDTYLYPWLKFAPFYAAICIVVFTLTKLYKSLWRFASFNELQRIIVATFITTAAHTILITTLIQRMPVSYYIIGAFLQFIFITGIRFSYRYILRLRTNKRPDRVNNCMVIGMHSIIGTT